MLRDLAIPTWQDLRPDASVFANASVWPLRGFLITSGEPMYDITTLHDQLKRRIDRDGRRQIIQTIPADLVRRNRSLRCCHLPAEQKPLIPVRDSRAYVPELSQRLDTDPNLTDGARRCARILAVYTYRRNRDTRTTQITVTYLDRKS